MMPKTEAGKRLAAELQVEYRINLINDIEAEAEHRGYLRANDCDHSECIERYDVLYALVREMIHHECWDGDNFIGRPFRDLWKGSEWEQEDLKILIGAMFK
jgi:hypothetical protein